MRNVVFVVIHFAGDEAYIGYMDICFMDTGIAVPRRRTMFEQIVQTSLSTAFCSVFCSLACLHGIGPCLVDNGVSNLSPSSFV
jgi:hypothetical protein